MTLVRYGAVENPFKSEMQLEEREDSYPKRADLRSIMEDFNPRDEDFWDKVHEKYNKEKMKKDGLKWTECLDEIRADRLVEKYDTFVRETREGNDPIVLMMTTWYDDIEQHCIEPFGSGEEGFASYERQIAKIAKILIDRDYAKHGSKSRYANPIIKVDGVKKTLLHLAAEGFAQRENLTFENRKRDFTEIAKSLLERDPDLVYIKTQPGKPRKQLPVEFALKYFDDEMASLLINATGNKSRIRLLFQYNEYFPEELPPFQFKTYIDREDMKKTVIAVLDSLISPDWPNMPENEQDTYLNEWHRVPDIPVRYHFYYQVLDGDNYGRGPFDQGFNHRDLSCLQAICLSGHNKNAIKHPVIRKLAGYKWLRFGKSQIILYAFMYLLYLILLSVSLLGAVHSKDPTKYETKNDRIRAACEVATLLFTVFYIFSEFDQMEKERKAYFYDPFNGLDLIGLFSLLAIVPLRFTKSNAQWHLATVTYAINCLRIFKYFPASKSLGLYAKTLYGLFLRELRVFAAVYLVILFTFAGGTYLSLRATTTYSTKTGFEAVGVTGFKDILLRGFRAVAESNGFADGYDSFSDFVTVIILISMLVIMLFLVNILIAQLTSTYDDAKANARLEYDIDKALFVTRLENSRFKSMNKRVKFFEEGEFVNDKDEIKELLKGWDELHPAAQDKDSNRVFK
ncbi:uncharacterized protein LOC135695372 [Rhopilema esculentum]|uniref:uncharacterized protein LOC135695372 n=1 Tax=Rhopilema esculentum TaxID=499914 RepID=UPI0031CFA6D5|eukprot:gene11607-21844_t